MKIEIEDLHQYLIDHKDEIDFLVLMWTCNPNYAVVETKNVGIVNGRPDVPLVARFSFNRIDSEYCFIGKVDDAIEYTKDYGQWDSCEFELEDGILTGEYDLYHSEADDFPEGPEDLSDFDVTDIEYEGLFYYDSYGKMCAYYGPVSRRKVNEDDD